MAKAPVAGAVKTRLCPPLHPTEAAELAAAALTDTLHVVAACGASERFVALDGEPGPWLPPGFTVIAQRGDTFAERLQNAWTDTGGPTLQIGMDTPQVTAELLDASLTALDSSPGAVLGHAHDGGWWALGMLRAHKGVFRDIPMSTPSTGAQQADRLHDLGLGPDLLPPLVDVDEWQHAVDVARAVPDGRFGRCVADLVTRIEHRSVPGQIRLGQGRAASAGGAP
ncbi:MAG: DUF2064 domain-containing protein [Candidatus Nanopelagicales bacterium]